MMVAAKTPALTRREWLILPIGLGLALLITRLEATSALLFLALSLSGYLLFIYDKLHWALWAFLWLVAGSKSAATMRFNLGPFNLYTTDLGIGFLLFAWGLRVLTRKPIVESAHLGRSLARYALPAFVFLFTVVLSMLLGLVEGRSYRQAIGFGRPFFYLVLIPAVAALTRLPQRILPLMWGLIPVGFYLTGEGIYRLVTGRGLELVSPMLSTGGFRAIGGSASVFLAFGLLACLSFWVYERGFSFRQILLLLATGLLGFGVLISMTRMTWVGLLVSVALLPCSVPRSLRRKATKRLIMLLALVMVGLAVLFLTLGPQLRQVIIWRIESLLFLSEIGDSSMQWRLAAWRSALAYIKRSPLVGVGYGQKLFWQVAGQVVIFPEPHNSYLWIGMSSGLIGLGAFLWLHYTFFRHLFQVRSMLTVPLYHAILTWVFTSYVTLLTVSLFARLLAANYVTPFYWSFIGLVGGLELASGETAEGNDECGRPV